MSHKSRIDWCVLAGIAVAIGALLVRASAWVAGPSLLILLLCAYPQSYETAREGLVVRDALTRRLIPYETITAASPAEWPGRMRLQYGAASHLAIAPADVDAFLADLAARAPHLVRRGRKLVLRDRHVEYSFRPAGGFHVGMGRG